MRKKIQELRKTIATHPFVTNVAPNALIGVVFWPLYTVLFIQDYMDKKRFENKPGIFFYHDLRPSPNYLDYPFGDPGFSRMSMHTLHVKTSFTGKKS